MAVKTSTREMRFIVSKRKSSVELAAEQLFKYCELYKASAIPNVLSPVFSF